MIQNFGNRQVAAADVQVHPAAVVTLRADLLLRLARQLAPHGAASVATSFFS